MLTIKIPSRELWNEFTEEFIPVEATTLRLEHSLVSISKWESRWHKPFLGKEDKSREEILDYIRCMTITQNVPPITYYGITEHNTKAVEEYIKNPMSATILPESTGGPSREVITSELIYYWMVAHNIPFECQKWHLNRLINLIGICNVKNQPPTKRSKSEILRRNQALNAQRRAKYNTKG